MGSFVTQPFYEVLAIVRSCLFGWAASRFFVEARRSGELELLLTSPAGAKTIVSSQWKELKRLFTWPVIILVASHLLTPAITIARFYSSNGGGEFRNLGLFIVTQCLNCASTIMFTGALIWAGLWFGLKARSQAGALARILLYGLVVPYVVSIAGSVLIGLFAMAVINKAGVRIGIFSPYGVYMVPSFGILFYYLWLIRWARRRLAGELRTAFPVRFSLRGLISGAGARLNSVVSKSRHWPPAPEE